jgi:hypothetical protein
MRGIFSLGDPVRKPFEFPHFRNLGREQPNDLLLVSGKVHEDNPATEMRGTFTGHEKAMQIDHRNDLPPIDKHPREPMGTMRDRGKYDPWNYLTHLLNI